MKLLFVVLFSFITILSTENEVENRIKCCEFIPEQKQEYFEDSYEYVKSMRVDMAHRNRNKIEYTLVAEEGEELKYITEFQYENIDNLNIDILNTKREAVVSEIKNIDKKHIELTTKIPKKGVYYLVFSKKNASDDRYVCAITMLFKKNQENSTE